MALPPSFTTVRIPDEFSSDVKRPVVVHVGDVDRATVVQEMRQEPSFGRVEVVEEPPEDVPVLPKISAVPETIKQAMEILIRVSSHKLI